MPRLTTAFAVAIVIFLLGFFELYSLTNPRIFAERAALNLILLRLEDAEPFLLVEEPVMRSARGAGVLESDLGIDKNNPYETSSKFPNHPEEYLGGSVRVEKGPFKGLFLVFDGVGWVEAK